MNGKIKVAILGVGNCASSFVQGIYHYSNNNSEDGLISDVIGGYKPICPVFNKSAPDTDGLKKINEEIKELNENLEALNMFDNPTNLPKDSPLSSLNKEKIQENLELLKNKRNDIEDELQELLRK